MKKTAFLYCFLSVLFLSITGCVFVLGGAAGALGAYGISRDTIQADTDKPYDMLWSSTLAVSRQRGTIIQEDNLKGYIEFQADSSHVWIKLIRMTQATTRIKISARKYHFPNLDLAQRIFVQIMEEAK
ncbi:MAG: DUF3568 family protein [Candidatus Omnitrophota bacterium]